jgi:peptidase inhibitor family I36
MRRRPGTDVRPASTLCRKEYLLELNAHRRSAHRHRERRFKMSFSRFRSLAFLGSACTAAALLVSTAAFATSSTAHAASSAQSARVSAEFRSAIAAQLRYNPSGTVINSSQISYDHGQVVVTVTVPGATPRYTCPSGSICLWNQANLTGNEATFKSPLQTPIRIHDYINRVKSLHNLRSTGSIIQKDKSASQAACYPAGARANDISSSVVHWPYLWLQKTDNC